MPEELVQFFKAKGISELYPPQEQAVRAGLLDGKSLGFVGEVKPSAIASFGLDVPVAGFELDLSNFAQN